MDPAQDVERSLFTRLRPIDEAISLGKSSVQQFYKDTTVFVTGASGFLGKQLVEKLLRSCEVKKMYLLLRQKKDKTTQQRLEIALNDPVYDLLRQKQPRFADKIAAIQGDITNIRLGLNDTDWHNLTQEVNVIIHSAATVKFDEPLKVAAITNIRGTMEALKLGKACRNLKCFTHISTAFAHTTVSRIDGDVDEMFYPCPIRPDVLVKLVENMGEERLDAITPELISGWPNTYTFTKAITEELIRLNAGDMPICIVKPPVVLGSYLEPSPGWIDLRTALNSVAGCIFGLGMGVLHILLQNQKTLISYAPVDYVNNAIIAAGWDAVENRIPCEKEPPIYTISSSSTGMKWEYIGKLMRSDEIVRLSTPKAVWYCSALEFSNEQLYWIFTWLFHYIPGYMVDGLVRLLGVREKYKIPSLVRLYTKFNKMSLMYKYFSFNTWKLKDDNLQAMIRRMSPEDRIIYDCDPKAIDFTDVFKAWCVGMRRYVIKDELRGSDVAYWRQKHVFFYIHYIFLAVYGYLIYFILNKIYTMCGLAINFMFSEYYINYAIA